MTLAYCHGSNSVPALYCGNSLHAIWNMDSTAKNAMIPVSQQITFVIVIILSVIFSVAFADFIASLLEFKDR